MDETATVTHSVTSGDNSYNGAPARSITVNVTDDDNRQVTVSYEPAMYTVAEGDMVTVTVTLNADPERTVVIPLTATGLDDCDLPPTTPASPASRDLRFGGHV